MSRVPVHLLSLSSITPPADSVVMRTGVEIEQRAQETEGAWSQHTLYQRNTEQGPQLQPRQVDDPMGRKGRAHEGPDGIDHDIVTSEKRLLLPFSEIYSA